MFLKRLESESITDYILRAENISNSLCSDMTNGSVSHKHMWVYILHIREHEKWLDNDHCNNEAQQEAFITIYYNNMVSSMGRTRLHRNVVKTFWSICENKRSMRQKKHRGRKWNNRFIFGLCWMWGYNEDAGLSWGGGPSGVSAIYKLFANIYRLAHQ